MDGSPSSSTACDSDTERDVQTLYPGPPKCPCCTNWVEEYPMDLKSSVEEQPESKRKALVVRMGINHGEGGKPLVLDSIVVQNQHIKDLLGDVFQGYGGITASLNKLVFRAPFHPFYHRWARFQSLLAQKKLEDASAAAYSQLLYDVLEQEIRETMEEANDLCAKQGITYELLWTLFEPGTLVYSTMNGLNQLSRVQSFHRVLDVGFSRIGVTYTDYNGHKFGLATTSLKIPSFEGTKKITSLNVHPTSFREDEGLMKADLWARGKRFYDLRGVQHKAYRGSCLLLDDSTSQFRRKLMLSNGSVRAYSLADKCWGLFSVDSVADIAWNDDAFPSLQLPEGHKDLILAFVDGQLSESQPFDDIIQGKGLGLTMLLVGSPGICKTLTAEAVADRLRKPLYMMSAGELGQSVTLGIRWRWRRRGGAILLLDECDIFLEKRSPSNLGHNEIVAVFLRTLEYYAGMLFLTSNRGDAIDEAFQSRIHLTLHYPELTTDAKYHIWDQFLKRVPSSDVSPIDMLKLANLSLNGRQIKKIVKTASLLARSQQSPSIEVKHIETVLEVTKQSGEKAKQERIDDTGDDVQITV
ncbi:AAA family ATPase [Apiospora aurea]|uniref:AAA family ATPase n=1 Tax=Apiospora aurea TaxID=335848 RepID=A0ABR1Q2A4_9PEZI